MFKVCRDDMPCEIKKTTHMVVFRLGRKKHFISLRPPLITPLFLFRILCWCHLAAPALSPFPFTLLLLVSTFSFLLLLLLLPG